jgi:hypothetical protein
VRHLSDEDRELLEKPVLTVGEAQRLQKIAAASIPQGGPIFSIRVNSSPSPFSSTSSSPLDETSARIGEFLYSRLSLRADPAFLNELVLLAQIEFDRGSMEDPIDRADRALTYMKNSFMMGMSEREFIAKEIMDAERIAFRLGKSMTGKNDSADGNEGALQMRAACVKVLDQRIETSRMYANSRLYHKERLEALTQLKTEIEQINPENLAD